MNYCQQSYQILISLDNQNNFSEAILQHTFMTILASTLGHLALRFGIMISALYITLIKAPLTHSASIKK